MEGVFLEPGLNYGGIFINENMAGFWVDTSAFVNSRTLMPGNYVLTCYLASDLTQKQIIKFTVPESPLPVDMTPGLPYDFACCGGKDCYEDPSLKIDVFEDEIYGIKYMYAFSEGEKARFVLKPDDIARCEEVLRQAGCL